MLETTEKEMIKLSIEEFSRLQDYLELIEKSAPVYSLIKKRYTDLKTFLQISGVNMSEIDRIKE